MASTCSGKNAQSSPGAVTITSTPTTLVEVAGGLSTSPEINNTHIQSEIFEPPNISDRPKHVRPELWQKFLALEKRTNEVTKNSTDRRIYEIKKNVIETVTNELTSPEDKVIMREHDVTLTLPAEPPRKRWKGKEKRYDRPVADEKGANDSAWEEVRSYLGVNDHLKGIDQGRGAPKTRLERGIDDAVSLGDFDLAEKLSNDLATRDFGDKIAKAFDARDYAKKKKEEDESSKNRKKRKLYWGFNQKQNWEMKSNM